MTWTITATGHAPSEALERELHQRVEDVISDPQYGITTSSFVGAWVNGPAHRASKPPPASNARQAGHSAQDDVRSKTA